MRSFILFFTILNLLFSCTSNTIYKKPKNLIPKEQMIDLLTDMHIATAAYHVKNLSNERKINYTALLFEKYGIDSLRFQESNIYYMSKIDIYDAMHKEVDKRLKKMQEEVEKEQAIKDSITGKPKKTIKPNKDKKAKKTKE